MLTHIRHLAVCLFLCLAACQPQEEVVPLPTLADLNAAAATLTAIAPTPRPTLPPTWTPSPSPTPFATDPAQAATPVPAGYNPAGDIYFIFNGDSIARLAGDGSSEELILIGSAPAYLTLSPDQSLLAYVAQGAGSGREVFIINRDGTYVQKVSCLGFARVLFPTWSPDGNTLAFLASPTLDGPLGVYVADIIGSGQCPTGNNQRLISQRESNTSSGLAWSPDGSKLFFGDGGIFGVDMTSGAVYPLTMPSGFGPDYSLAHHPVQNRLYYLRSTRNLETNQSGGTLYLIDTTIIEEPPTQFKGAELFARALRWSRDGRYLLITTADRMLVLSAETNTTSEVLTGFRFLPQAVFSPDAEQIAYIDGGRDDPAIQQIFTIDRRGETEPIQLTKHLDGTISDLVWAEG